MMGWAEKIAWYYRDELWTKQQVWNVVGKVLTPEEYQIITGEEYKKD
jgi:hypothetical protein